MRKKEILIIPTKRGKVRIEIFTLEYGSELLISANLNNLSANITSVCKNTGIKEALSYFIDKKDLQKVNIDSI